MRGILLLLRKIRVQKMNLRFLLTKEEGRKYMRPYNALEVAEYIIERCNQKNKSISNLKLQKILYFVQAQFIVEFGTPCFDNIMQAWDYGPVVPDVYHKYKVYGNTNIPSYGNKRFNFEQDEQQTLDTTIDSASEYAASRLVEITHNQSPWIDAYKKADETITPESIRKFFMA